jgi:hypothetical protein
MISTADFIRLPFTSDLTEGGIVYATHSLSQSYDRWGGSLYSRLCRLVGGVAVDLAFRRYLGAKCIPFDVKGSMPFSEPNRYDVLLGGRRCNINTFLISNRNQITTIRRNINVVLDAPARMPEEQFSTANHTGKDLHFFTFLLGLTTNSPEGIRKAVAAGQRICLVHPMGIEWSQPNIWVPLGKLVLKSECATPITIEIGGQDADRNFISEILTLHPLARTFAVNSYFSLAYLRTEGIPTARVGLHCASQTETYIIQPHEWGNIWVYGLEIWLLGYITQDEFRRKASSSFTGSRVFQYSKTQTKNLSVPVTDLRPLEGLFAQVKSWDVEKKSW